VRSSGSLLEAIRLYLNKQTRQPLAELKARANSAADQLAIDSNGVVTAAAGWYRSPFEPAVFCHRAWQLAMTLIEEVLVTGHQFVAQ
jgi:hypothetical protein